jgi:8-amino-7-oxononanoate synthase
MYMIPSWIDEFPARIGELDRDLLRRHRRVIVPKSGARMCVDGQSMLAFCSNDYLGLAGHPDLIEAACAGAREFGVGSGSSPLLSGHSAANDALEHQLAAFTRLPRALYFYAGYATNLGVITALVGEGDALFADTLNHASLIDGARLSRAKVHIYAHADLRSLETALSGSTERRKLVVSEAVFSIDGDFADIPRLLALCEQYDALLLLDDAHGFGVLGPQGRGSLARFGLIGEHASHRVLYMATLGKAAGVAGAFVAGGDVLIEWLLQNTRNYIFATAAPPMLASALRASLRLIEAEQLRRDHLNALVAQLRSGLGVLLRGKPWKLRESMTAIQALVIGSSDEALAVMEGLRERGLFVPAICPPWVPEGTVRLRIALSAAHSHADVDHLILALCELAQTQGTTGRLHDCESPRPDRHIHANS